MAAMGFFQAQERARSRTFLLVVLMIAAVAGVVACVYGGSQLLLAYMDVVDARPIEYRPELLLPIASCVLAVVLVGTIYKMLMLAGGGQAVAHSLGGVTVSSDTTDAKERQLLNIVEEMSIAAGVPMPLVFLIPSRGVNAFAAGTSVSNAVIGVTRGALKEFNRHEMQGVIAHEFSHILNGDMRLNIRLIGIIHGIMLLSFIGYFMVRSATRTIPGDRESSKGKVFFFMLGLILAVSGAVGSFFGSMIRAAVSRQREYLADAAAVQFTRHPEGIASAIQTIGRHRGLITVREAAECAHMFFSPGTTTNFTNPFASHPPPDKRIQRILPTWDGKAQIMKKAGPAVSSRSSHRASSKSASVSSLLGEIGILGVQALHSASAQQTKLPHSLRLATRNPYSARALVYALLLDKDRSKGNWRQQQLAHLEQHADTGVYDLVLKLTPDIAMLPKRSYLLLIQACSPALRQLSDSQAKTFLENISRLIDLDESVETFEWCIEAAVAHILLANQPEQRKTEAPEDEDYALALSMLAQVGNPTYAEACFKHAAGVLGKELSIMRGASSKRMFLAAQRLAELAPKKKETFVRSAIACVEHDGHITADQAALLRAYLMIIDCPLPATVGQEG